MYVCVCLHVCVIQSTEFVGSYSTPLSSDAFSRMARHPTAADNNNEVRTATALLLEKTLPAATVRILRKLVRYSPTPPLPSIKCDPLWCRM